MPPSYIITDVGSTTTKAILVGPEGRGARLLGRAEAPTTVEKPFEDVTVGVRSALRRLEEVVGRELVPEICRTPGEETRGQYWYLSTSSAGGGLQILVYGLTKSVTADSARRAALGGGAIILDVMATDDGRQGFVKMDAVRNCRPDMVLIAGGLDGGNIQYVLEVCDVLNAAKPRPRFGSDFRIPVIYAGNKDASETVRDTLSDLYDLTVVDNLRPTLEREVLGPARNAIHELFMSHVMQQAPGYGQLSTWVDEDILPTPAAVGRIMELVAQRQGTNILGVDIGGATTDVFSVIDGTFFRSVSANLGMSYSSGNVLVEAGLDNIVRWLPFNISPYRVADRILTKLIHPTTLPGSEQDLQIEQALATEAVRLAFSQHRTVAVLLPRKASFISTRFFAEGRTGTHEQVAEAIDVSKIGLFVGSGGALSHAPRRNQAALMLLNALQPEGKTFFSVDSVFMMPHLGVLSGLDPDAALNVLEKDCLVPLGPVIAPAVVGTLGQPAVSVSLTVDGERITALVNAGDIRVIPLAQGHKAKVEVEPLGQTGFRGMRRFEFDTVGGTVGVIVDARGRPIPLPADPEERARANARWATQIGAYDLHGEPAKAGDLE
ncbi:MAG: glutamate mutase L [Bacillota bacterium]|nr:methylaspartate mutase [Candidatus Fermentithermobacillaceae bacterium]